MSKLHNKNVDIIWVYFFGLFRICSEHSMCPRSMKWFRTFWRNNMVDKLTLLFLSAELEMDDDDHEMNLEESVVTVAIVAAST